MVFHKHHLSTYGDNYRYGSTLYDTSVSEAEKKYRNTLAKTPVRSDRGDLGMYSFVGSHIHGGAPATGTGLGGTSYSSAASSGGKATVTSDLYAPLSFGYGRGYYNHLRADYQKPKPKASKSADYYSSVATDETTASGMDLKTHSAKSTTSYDDVKKTITTTTTTERWVPLSSYLYSYPSHYYHYSSSPLTTTRTSKTTDDIYYEDDYYKSTVSSSKSRNIEALDLNISSQNMEKFDYNMWIEKCRDIQSHLDQVNHWVAEADAKIKTDVVGARNKMQTELTELTLMVDDTSKYNDELQKVIKRQARQITDLHSQYDDINRHLVEVTDNLEKSRVRCQTLTGDLASVQTGLEMAMRRK